MIRTKLDKGVLEIELCREPLNEIGTEMLAALTEDALDVEHLRDDLLRAAPVLAAHLLERANLLVGLRELRRVPEPDHARRDLAGQRVEDGGGVAVAHAVRQHDQLGDFLLATIDLLSHVQRDVRPLTLGFLLPRLGRAVYAVLAGLHRLGLQR